MLEADRHYYVDIVREKTSSLESIGIVGKKLEKLSYMEKE